MAAGFNERGVIAEGMRGDVILVDRRGALDVRVVCAISNGRVVYLNDTDRLHMA
jgi:alpha-D-ribose 1-methylphosphonate 5-triphosphate diphosphatase PhnM